MQAKEPIARQTANNDNKTRIRIPFGSSRKSAIERAQRHPKCLPALNPNGKPAQVFERREAIAQA